MDESIDLTERVSCEFVSFTLFIFQVFLRADSNDGNNVQKRLSDRN